MRVRAHTILVAVVAAILPTWARAADQAACNLTSSTLGDYYANTPSGPKGEDLDFLTSSAGTPTVLFLLDSSTSMHNVPPDGAKDTWGGLGSTYGCTSPDGNTLVFHSPCGTTIVDGQPYSEAIDFAQATDAGGAYCPSLIAGQAAPVTNRPGFDPDFFCPEGGTSCNGHPNFFEPVSVYEEGTWNYSKAPRAGAGTVGASRTTFCASQGAAKQSSCDTCLQTKGYWYSDSDSRVFFTGNFLNFFPPKFVIARKVLKDTLANTHQVRMGLAKFGPSGEFAEILSQLGPSCDKTFPPVQTAFDSTRDAILLATNTYQSEPGTPLAEALLSVGQLFHSSSLPWFDSSFQAATMNEGTGTAASWCFSCQKASVLIISDGMPTKVDTKVPGTSFAPQAMTRALANTAGNYAGMAGYNITGISADDCPLCYDLEKKYPEVDSWNLAKVAWYLHHMDLRDDAENGADCKPMTGKQSLDVYTIGFGTGKGGASVLLNNAAHHDPTNPDNDVGGGFFSGANDTSTLRNAIAAVLGAVNARSTSFSGSGISTLQTTAGAGVLVPRFDPKKTALWNGRFYRFSIRSEFAAGCIETDSAGTTVGAGDLDCDHACSSVFLQDSQGYFIQEDNDGDFVRNSPDKPNCGPSNKCSTCGSPSTTAASPVWEAGQVMGATKWSARKVYTVVDSSGDGLIDSADALFLIAEGGDVSDAAVTKLTPYVAAGGTVCANLATALTTAGNPDGAVIQTELAASPRSVQTCVRNMLRFLLGADIFNEKAATAPAWPPTGAASLANRTTLLGDIFHSSPVVVIPPVKRGPFCESVSLAEPQCIMSLYSTSPGAERYDYYAGAASTLPGPFNPVYKHRDQFALVGANDLLLHAFHTGAWATDTRALPYDGHWDDGTGEEIWAFAPPDLMPKLPFFVATGGAHQYYVDATPAVRDIWVDGTSNKLGSGIVDDIKQESEYHTVAVLGERRGGTHYFALDVTNAAKNIDGKPAFLWIYPQPSSPESSALGWTFQSFMPHPPSIGPVRIKADTVYTNTRSGLDSSGNAVSFHDRYVTLLSGGYDPQYARGHGVYMLDVWTGKKIWDFAEPASGSGVPADDPRWNLKFPVVATVGMSAWGNTNQRLGLPTTDLWFDTATFGDTGGQIWALRFYDPGELDASGQIKAEFTRWTGARLFQGGAVTNTDPPNLKASQPFFQMAANVFTSVDSSLRVVLGSGDAMNLLDKNGGTCGPDNIRACSLSGCQVAIDEAFNNAGSPGGYTVAGATVPTSGVFNMTHSTTAGAANSCGTTPSTSSVDLLASSCPNPLVAGNTSTRRLGGGTCSVEGGTFACTARSANDDGFPLQMSASMPAITLGNCFYVIRVFDQNHHPIFNDTASAKLYDSQRISEATTRSGIPALKRIDPNNLTPTAADLATSTDDGWYMCYSHSSVYAEGGTSFGRVAVDERTATSATVTASTGCAAWSTIQPLQSPNGTCGLSPCSGGGNQLGYQYGARVATGDLCLGYDASSNAFTTRSVSWRTGVPPAPQMPVTSINSSGQVSRSLVSMRVPEGANSQSTGAVEDLVQKLEWLDVDRSTHDCRHVTGGACP